MDVLRRAVGDARLSFLGFSYGTYLGQVYANMFPDRVRSIVIDGVLDPVAWAGTAATSSTPQTMRLKSGEGGAKALHEILVRCEKAGAGYCAFAGLGDPQDDYEAVITALKKKPLVVDDPVLGSFTVTYADVVGTLLGMLYSADAADFVDPLLTSLFQLTEPVPAVGSAAAAVRTPAARAAAKGWLRSLVRTQKAGKAAARAEAARQRKAFGFSFPYFNGAEAFQSVLCTDGLNPKEPGRGRGTPTRPPSGLPTSVRCGPGRRRRVRRPPGRCATRTPTGGRSPAARQPGAGGRRLLRPGHQLPGCGEGGLAAAEQSTAEQRQLGHTAYGTSACVSDAVNSYLLTLALPRRGTVCTGDSQPFTVPLPTNPPTLPAVPPVPAPTRKSAAADTTSGRRAPVVPLLPMTPRW